MKVFSCTYVHFLPQKNWQVYPDHVFDRQNIKWIKLRTLDKYFFARIGRHIESIRVCPYRNKLYSVCHWDRPSLIIYTIVQKFFEFGLRQQKDPTAEKSKRSCTTII